MANYRGMSRTLASSWKATIGFLLPRLHLDETLGQYKMVPLIKAKLKTIAEEMSKDWDLIMNDKQQKARDELAPTSEVSMVKEHKDEVNLGDAGGNPDNTTALITQPEEV